MPVDRSDGEHPGQKPGAGCGDLVEMKRPAGLLAERAFGHDREHAGASGGFEHDIAGPDGGCLQGGVGERERRRELLQRDLFLGSPRLRRLQGGEDLQHGALGGGTAEPGAGLPAHGAAVALEEENQSRLGRRQAARSRIVTTAHGINRGAIPDLSRPERDSDFYFLPAEDPETAAARIVKLVKTRIPQRFGFDAMQDTQVLCPMNRGGAGARSLNIELQAALNPAGERKVERFGWTLAPGATIQQAGTDLGGSA